jgi:hypothetical protein
MFMRYFGGGIGHMNQGSQWKSADDFDVGNLEEEEEMEKAEPDGRITNKNDLELELAGGYESDSDSCEHSDSEDSSCSDDSDKDSDNSSESESDSDLGPEDGENFYSNEAHGYESL